MESAASNRKKFVWNLLGSLSNSLSSIILSVCVNRVLGGNYGGIFAFAYSNAQLMLTVGCFEVRPYQSTDVKEKYSFNVYFNLRVLTCMLMVVATSIYIIINDFTFEKNLVVFILMMFKMVEAFSDVYGGRFQQRDRLDLSGKIFFLRVTVSTLIFIVLILLSNNLIIASTGMFLSSFVLFWIYDIRFVFLEDKRPRRAERASVLKLIKEVLPLFIGAFIMMYIGNAPKYAINSIFSDEIQNIYNILFMPAFVINLFSIFIFRPLLIRMAVYWEEKKINDLRKIILFMYISISGITLVALVGTWFFGIPILSLLYGINLKKHRMELMIIMLTGGISALVSFSSNVVVVMRKQQLLLLGYIITFIYTIFFVKGLVKIYEIKGAILSYGIAMMLLVLVFNIIIYTGISKKGKVKG